MPLLKSYVNPLKCTEIDLLPSLPAAQAVEPPEADRLLDYLCAPQVDHSREAFVARYREMALIPDPLSIVPAEPTILEKLVWPLRHAKGSYALGNYVGCIALCGTVGEMVAILLWDMSKVALQDHQMTDAEQRAMFGNTFEQLGQNRRVNILHTLKLVDDATKDAFDRLRATRNRYLHNWSQTHAQVASDARGAYEAALKVVSVALGQTIKDGAVVLRPDLMAYLIDKGIVQADEEQGPG